MGPPALLKSLPHSLLPLLDLWASPNFTHTKAGYNPESQVLLAPVSDVVFKHAPHLVKALPRDGHPGGRQLLLAGTEEREKKREGGSCLQVVLDLQTFGW